MHPPLSKANLNFPSPIFRRGLKNLVETYIHHTHSHPAHGHDSHLHSHRHHTKHYIQSAILAHGHSHTYTLTFCSFKITIHTAILSHGHVSDTYIFIPQQSYNIHNSHTFPWSWLWHLHTHNNTIRHPELIVTIY